MNRKCSKQKVETGSGFGLCFLFWHEFYVRKHKNAEINRKIGSEFCFTSTCSMTIRCFLISRDKTRYVSPPAFTASRQAADTSQAAHPSHPFVPLTGCAFCRRRWQESRNGVKPSGGKFTDNSI